MIVIRILSLALIGLFMAACSGTVKMSPLDPETIKNNYIAKGDVEGIIVYRAIPRVQVDKFIQINVPANPAQPNGPIVPSSDCTHVLTRKVVSVADSEHPYRLHYDHGFLETYTFGATLTSEGILTVINTASTPDQGKTFQNLASAAASGAAAAAVAPLPNCTVTPIFVGYEELPLQADMKKFGETK